MADARRRIAAATLLSLVTLVRAAGAQDDVIVDDASPPRQGMQEPIMGFNNNNMGVNLANNFDRYIFGNVGTAVAARARLGNVSTLRIEAIERTCRLGEAQRTKLRLAAKGDVKRFFDGVEAQRRQSLAAQVGPNNFQQFNRDIQPFRLAYERGLLGDGSLFAKTLATTLDPEQAASTEAAERGRREYRDRAKVEMSVAMIDACVGLTEAQRGRVLGVVADKTRPAKNPGSLGFLVVLYQLAKLPDAEFKVIFTDAQWKLLGPQLDLARQYEPTLRSNDMLPDPPAKPEGGGAKGVKP